MAEDTSKQDDQRKFPRVRVNCPVKVLEDQKLVGTLYDISRGGFRIELFGQLVDSDQVNEWTGESEPDALVADLTDNAGDLYRFDLEHLGTSLGRVYTRLVHAFRRRDNVYMGLQFIGSLPGFPGMMTDAMKGNTETGIDLVKETLETDHSIFQTTFFPDSSLYQIGLPKDFDNMAIHPFKDEILPIIEQKKFGFIFDFSMTSFVNSMGIGTLFSAAKSVMDSSQPVIFSHLSPAVNRIFSMVGITRKLRIEEDEMGFLNELFGAK